MQRRNFLKSGAVAGAALWLNPWKTLARMVGNKNCAVRVAHVENVAPKNLEELYCDHALLCHSVHKWAANKVAETDVPVELLRINPLAPSEEEWKKLRGLDVFSVSSVIDHEPSRYSREFAKGIPLIKDFWKESDTVSVWSAGNSGGKGWKRPHESIEDFGDASSLRVGEAERNAKGEWFVRAESEDTGNISLVSSHPLNDNLRFPYVNLSPDLTGREALIEGWLIYWDAKNKATAATARLAEPDVAQIRQERIKLEHNPEYRKALSARASAYIADPPSLHKLVLSELRKRLVFDEHGWITGFSGTSFAAPVVAGAISAAKYLGKLRQCYEDNPAILNSQELVALAMLATKPITKLDQNNPSEIKVETNERGLSSSMRAGFGQFDLDKFRELLMEANKLLTQNRSLQSEPQTLESRAFRKKKNAENTFKIRVPNPPLRDDTTVMRLRLEYKSAMLPPETLIVVSPSGTEYPLHMIAGTNQDIFTKPPEGKGAAPAYCSWGVTDRFFGEKAGGNWKVIVPPQAAASAAFDPKDLKLTLHGVRKGGLIDKMIDHALNLQKGSVVQHR